MFNLGSIGSSFYGHPQYNGKVNGADFAIMHSQACIKMVIPEFENAIAAGYDPNIVKDMIFAKFSISEDDFTSSDRKLLQRKVEEIYQSQNKTRR